MYLVAAQGTGIVPILYPPSMSVAVREPLAKLTLAVVGKEDHGKVEPMSPGEEELE